MNFPIFTILLICQGVFAQSSKDCLPCDPLAEVSITNKGLSRLIETSLKQNFIELNKAIRDRAGFRDLVLDRSHCKPQTIAEAYKDQTNPDPASCLGLPDLSDDTVLSRQTPLRPFKAQMSDLRLKQLELDLVTPVQCKNFTCQLQVKLKNLDLDGNISVDYTDKNESFIPKTKLHLASTPDVDVSLSAEAYLNPKTGKLEDLVFLSPNQTNLVVKPGSFNFSLDFKKRFDSAAKEAALHGKHFKKQVAAMQSQFSSSKYLQAQVDSYIDQQVFHEWVRTKDRSVTKDSVRKKIESSLLADYGGSKKTLVRKLSQMQWPDLVSDDQINAFMKNPPAEIKFVPDLTDRVQAAHISALAENAGFSSAQGFQFAMIGVYAANQIQNSPQLLHDVLEPLLEKEIVPAVEVQVNQELRHLQNYWNQISKIPSLNIQDLKAADNLKNRLAKAKTARERQIIQEQIEQLNAKMHDDWIPIDTAVFIDQSLQSSNVIQAQITSSDPACNTTTKTFSNDQDDDFDLRTSLGPNALQEYFNQMAAHKKLDFCAKDSVKNTPPDCNGGTLIQFKKPPKLTCDNGQIIFDLDADAQRSLIEVGLQGQIRAEVKNCEGSPCIQLSDTKGRFKNVFLNTFFGSFIQRSLELAVNSSTNQPLPLSHVRLKKLQTDPKNCNTKLDWDIQP